MATDKQVTRRGLFQRAMGLVAGVIAYQGMCIQRSSDSVEHETADVPRFEDVDWCQKFHPIVFIGGPLHMQRSERTYLPERIYNTFQHFYNRVQVTTPDDKTIEVYLHYASGCNEIGHYLGLGRGLKYLPYGPGVVYDWKVIKRA